MGYIEAKNNPAKTSMLETFCDMKDQDELTYTTLSILRYQFGIEFAEECLTDYYMKELKSICTKADNIRHEDRVRYQYRPDLLSYDLYGTTQLDWIIMLCNGIIDPKDFDMKSSYLYAPKTSALRAFLSRVYNSEGNWLDINRTELKEAKIKGMNRED